MYYEILKEMNPHMKLAIADGSLYVLKEIGLEDTEMYQKLIRLDCKNIVRFYDTVAQDGRFYAVEEFINGGSTLRAYMERRGPLSDLETKNIALQICNGLKQVHKLGIVHRDINPNNIMLAADGTVKISTLALAAPSSAIRAAIRRSWAPRALPHRSNSAFTKPDQKRIFTPWAC